MENNRLLLFEIDWNIKDNISMASKIDTKQQMERKVSACIKEVLYFREMIQDAIVRFYELEFSGINDINIELLQNMVTSLVVKDELYVFLICLYTLKNLKDVVELEKLFCTKQKVDLTFLDVRDDFKLNRNSTFIQLKTSVIENMKKSFQPVQAPRGTAMFPAENDETP